jgi:hypothetical protein
MPGSGRSYCLSKKITEKAVGDINTSLRCEKISSMVDDILRAQRSPSHKTGLGYADKQKSGESSGCSKVNMKNQGQSYADVLKRSKDYDKHISNKIKDTEVKPSKGKNASNHNDHI